MVSDINISVHLLKIFINMLLTNTFLGMIGGPQIILIIAVVLLLFGGRKIPELMRGLGSCIKEFKNATKDEEEKAQVEESSSKKS